RRMARPDGPVMHAEVRLGGSAVMMGEPCSQSPPMPGCVLPYVNDADAVYRRALEAGAVSLGEPSDQLYGDRIAGVKDPARNVWWIATRQEDVSDDELERRQAAHLARQAAG